MHNTMPDGTWVFVIELSPDAVMTSGRAMVERVATLAPVPVIVVNHAAVPPDDRGDRVVVKLDLRARARRMRGKFLGHLDTDKTIGVYDLRMAR